MSEKHEKGHGYNHQGGCGCTPTLFVNMVEKAGLALSRRDFIKGTTAMGGMFAVGSLAAPMLAGCKGGSKDVPAGSLADAIYFGGPIVTMVKDGDRAEALAVKDGRILSVGAKTDVMARKGDATKLIDLGGKTLMPGFYDPHSHVVLQSVKFATANLDPIPIGKIGSIADIQQTLRDWIKEKKPAPGKWVIGWGYDDTGIEEQRHPTREDLDAVSTDHPILLMHISAHLMAGNSRLMEEIGVTKDTKDPEGGVIQRKPGSNEPNGVLEENAMLLVLKKIQTPTPEQAMAMLEEGLRHYAEAGITTAQDCASGKGTWQLLAAMAQANKLPIDVNAWALYKGVDDATFDAIAAHENDKGRLKLGGVKLTLDGSIQGYTGYLSRPYHVQPGKTQITTDHCDSEEAESLFVSPDNQTDILEDMPAPGEDHRGYPSMTQEQVDTWVRRCDGAGIQIQAHTNGDAATDMLIAAVKKSRPDKPRPELRTTIIHAQTMREDQLDFAAEHGLTPSFFPIHVYFWGDRHRDLFLGPERAARINPSRSALDRNIRITLHHDAPVAGIDMLAVAWTAVNRVTSGGKDLGPEQRITPFEAFRAITADAAWQNFEEDRKGTLEAGKLADLVVLSDDPLAIDPMRIRDIQILETIKEGQHIFSAKG
jgi:predicted amidohydrolase YtcJ